MSFSFLRLVRGERNLQLEAGSQGALIKLQSCREKGATQQKTLGRPPRLQGNLFNMCIFSQPPSVVWPPAAHRRYGGFPPLPCGRPRPLGAALSCLEEPERWWAAAKVASPAERSVSVASRSGDGEWPDPTDGGAQTRTSGWDKNPLTPIPPNPPSRRAIVALNRLCYCAAECGCVRAAHCFVAPAGCFLLRRLHFAWSLGASAAAGANIVFFLIFR